MHCFLGYNRILTTCALLVSLVNAPLTQAAMDPRFELDVQALESKAKKHKADKRGAKGRRQAPESAIIYTVKPGDFLFKILMREYQLSSAEAERYIDTFHEELRRENRLGNLTRLQAGQKLVLPPIPRKAESKDVPAGPSEVATDSVDRGNVVAGQSFRLMSPASAADQDVTDGLKKIWKRLIPATTDLQKPLAIETSTFSLSLDPEQYPVFPAMDGGRILLDRDGKIPPLVKSLIQEKDPQIRIVSESPEDTKKLVAAMLGSAGFYSIEENFSMTFGEDPKLTVNSDFKIEKTPESLIKQEVVLLNSGKSFLPLSLNKFLKKEGFSVHEPFASLRMQLGSAGSKQLYQITSRKQPEIVESLLKALSISYERNRRIDVFAADRNGISLSVNAERFFEQDGQRFIVSRFDGDPVAYTLFRLLETKGYRVVMLNEQDGFRKITEKILGRLHIKNEYSQHRLRSDDPSYSVEMSGFKLEANKPGGSLYITDLAFDRVISDLLGEDGYKIEAK